MKTDKPQLIIFEEEKDIIAVWKDFFSDKYNLEFASIFSSLESQKIDFNHTTVFICNSDINIDVLKVMSKYDNICKNIHLPLQSGSTKILKVMNRTYTKENFLNLVKIIKEYIPDCSLSTDIIVGFPGEDNFDFQETLDVVKKVEFNFSYMFKYSSRPGTKAAQYTNQINEDIKQCI